MCVWLCVDLCVNRWKGVYFANRGQIIETNLYLCLSLFFGCFSRYISDCLQLQPFLYAMYIVQPLNALLNSGIQPEMYLFLFFNSKNRLRPFIFGSATTTQNNSFGVYLSFRI